MCFDIHIQKCPISPQKCPVSLTISFDPYAQLILLLKTASPKFCVWSPCFLPLSYLSFCAQLRYVGCLHPETFSKKCKFVCQFIHCTPLSIQTLPSPGGSTPLSSSIRRDTLVPIVNYDSMLGNMLCSLFFPLCNLGLIWESENISMQFDHLKWWGKTKVGQL